MYGVGKGATRLDKLIALFLAFFQIGLFSIGGGYAVMPAIQEQVVHQHGWLTEKTFTDIITISQMTPGPIAVNTSTFVGIQIAGIPGALVATFGCVISGVVLAVLLFRFFQRHLYVSETLKGLKSASLGLIASAAATILLLTFCGTSDLNFGTAIPLNWMAVALFSAALFLLHRKKISPIPAMLLTGVAGLFLY